MWGWDSNGECKQGDPQGFNRVGGAEFEVQREKNPTILNQCLTVNMVLMDET